MVIDEYLGTFDICG